MIKKLLYDFKLVILLMLCSIAKAQTTPISYSASPSFSNVVSGQSFTFSNISTCQTSVTLDVSNYWSTFLNNYPVCNINYRFRILVNNVEIGNNYCDGTFDLSSYIPVNSVQIVPYHSGAGNGNSGAKMDVVLTVNSPTASMPPLATTSDVFYCYSATASPLSPTLVGSGASFKWYTVATGGLPSTTAPTPNTNISNTSSYWVSQVTASGCEGQRKEIQVTVNPAIVTSVGNQVNVLCHGSTTGSATVNVTGGTGTYTYSWNTTPVQTTATATGLAAGTYTVTVTDATLCFKTQSFTITEPSVLTASAGTQVNVLCRGNATGTATVNVTGGNGAYSYSWNTTPVQTTATATGLAAGNYTVTVTDANLCTTTQGFTITQPTAALVATAGTQVDVLCNGNATGEATVTATGGTGAYTYSWNTTPVQTTATATALAAGTYIATVTDANLCTATQSFTITEPAVLTATAGTQVDVLCNGNATGEATVNVTGGTGTYTYSWDTTPVQTTATASNLSAGTYIATVTDANNCTATQSFTITEPIVLTASAGTQVNVLCHGNATGEATVTATGGTGAYTYSWNTTPVQTTATAAGLAAGTYIATVTDANNCTATQSFTITEPATALTASAGTQVDVLCHGNATGEATVTATGGTGSYSYSWNTTPVQTTATASNLTAGNYTATVTDANGCTATQSFTITEPVSALALTPNTTQTDILCNGQATGSATVAVTGGTGSYTYLWSNGATTNTITGLLAGTYTVDVTDANGCVLSNSFTITEPIALTATVDSQTNVLCYGDTTGSATVAVTGGTGAYTYSWDTTPV
ncbi:SprB-like repeat protein, partial [Flavobacterium sp. AG291]